MIGRGVIFAAAAVVVPGVVKDTAGLELSLRPERQRERRRNGRSTRDTAG